MIYQLITTNPITRVMKPVGGYLPQRIVADGQEITAPDGHTYVPILERPDYNRSTQRLVRHTTLEGDGWIADNLTTSDIISLNQPPQTVTRRQLFLTLASLTTPITRQMIKQMVGGNELALIEFEEAMSFDRDHPMIESLATRLGMTDEQVDNLFRQAATL